MDPHDLLIAEHKTLRTHAALLKEQVLKAPQELEKTLKGFQATVRQHFQHEDTYYRILDNEKRFPDRAFVHQLRNDHAAVIFTLESLAIRIRKSGFNADWKTRFENMMNVFLPHLDQEEQKLFSEGRKLLTSTELNTIAKEITSDE